MPARRTPVGASSARALSDMAPVYTDLPREQNGRQRHEDHRRHAHAVRLGRHPADAIRPAQQVRRLERARAVAHRHRRRRRGPRLSRFGVEFGDHRRAGADHASQARADGPESAASRSARRRSVEEAARLWRARHRRGRRGAVGPFGQGGRPADPSPARHLSRGGAGLCQLRRARCARGLCRGGAEVQGARLGRLQDPSADALEGGHQGLRGGAQGGRRLHHHARLRPGPTITRRRCGSAAPPRRWASTGTRIRWPTRTSTIT